MFRGGSVSLIEAQEVVEASRGAAMDLALQVARASQACTGEAAEGVIGSIGVEWYAALPIELRTILTMAADMAVCAQLIKSG
jgi:hypothetical protein